MTNYDDGDYDKDGPLSGNACYFLQELLDLIDIWHRRPEHLLDGDDATLARLRGLACSVIYLIDRAPDFDVDVGDACWELKEGREFGAILADPKGMCYDESAEEDAEAEPSRADDNPLSE